MPSENKCEFTTGADKVIFLTQVNGDRIEFRNLKLTAEAAAVLATLINEEDLLSVSIKKG